MSGLECNSTDMLEDMFEKQVELMKILRDADKLPEWPVDLTSKPGQRIIKETIYYMFEELAEASFTLRNKMHRISDVRSIDIDHYKEELSDALAFFLEVCVMSGISPKELHEQFVKKNSIVQERIKNGY